MTEKKIINTPPKQSPDEILKRQEQHHTDGKLI